MGEPLVPQDWFNDLCARLGVDPDEVLAEANRPAPSLVEVPVRWCVVHNATANGKRCSHAVVLMSGTSRMGCTPPPEPCQLVPLYRYPTKETPA